MVIIFTTITNGSRPARWWRAVDVSSLPFQGPRVHIHSRVEIFAECRRPAGMRRAGIIGDAVAWSGGWG
jgi:hypothetical protein